MVRPHRRGARRSRCCAALCMTDRSHGVCMRSRRVIRDRSRCSALRRAHTRGRRTEGSTAARAERARNARRETSVVTGPREEAVEMSRDRSVKRARPRISRPVAGRKRSEHIAGTPRSHARIPPGRVWSCGKGSNGVRACRNASRGGLTMKLSCEPDQAGTVATPPRAGDEARRLQRLLGRTAPRPELVEGACICPVVIVNEPASCWSEPHCFHY